ncbi:unnamed protein product [Gordionus sp. m RMFG-2023]|uniref:neutral amino acid transporter 9-like n=1 Tax=Gordionus sp. m RMFG-2023 TaxID=3053472 RepID=UPI0030E1758A
MGDERENRRLFDASISKPSYQDYGAINDTTNCSPPLKAYENNIIQGTPHIDAKKPFHFDSGLGSDKSFQQTYDQDSSNLTPILKYEYNGNLVNDYNSSRQNSNGGEYKDSNIPKDDITPDEILTVVRKEGSVFYKRLITVFTLWNTMVGSGMLAMPWAFFQAGYIAGTVFIILFGFLGFFTCYLILRQSHNIKTQLKFRDLPDFSDVCGYYIGPRWGRHFSSVISIFLLTAAMLVYWILMSSYLYDIVIHFYSLYSQLNPSSVPPHLSIYHIFHGNASNMQQPQYKIGKNIFYKVMGQSNTSNTSCPQVYTCRTQGSNTDPQGVLSWWSQYRTAPLALILLLFPLMNFKSPKFFSRLNSLGTVSVITIIAFVTRKCLVCYFSSDSSSFVAPTQSSFVPFSPSFPKLTGILALALLIHNAFIPIFNVETNFRPLRAMAHDLAAGYFLATFTYLFVGFVFYYGFVRVGHGGDLLTCPLRDNFLENVPYSDTFACAVRLLLLFQMATVFPLVAYLVRVQAHSLLFQSLERPKLTDRGEDLLSTKQSSHRKIMEEQEPLLTDDRLENNGHIYRFSALSSTDPRYLLPLNTVLVCICLVFAMFLPKIGYILRFAGGFCGFIYIFLYPCIVWALSLKECGQITPLKLTIIFVLILLGASNFVSQFFN